MFFLGPQAIQKTVAGLPEGFLRTGVDLSRHGSL